MLELEPLTSTFNRHPMVVHMPAFKTDMIYRLTKFQPFVSEQGECETLAAHLVNSPGTKQWLVSQAVQ